MNFPEIKELPDGKIYFSIGEVAELLGVERSTLRYWEKEFSTLNPSETPGGQRRYHRDDIRTILRIRHLLKEERYTIEGARQKLTARESMDTEAHRDQVRKIVTLCEDALEQIEDFRREQL